MHLELTKEQFRELIKVVHLGSWLINSYRTAEQREESVEKLEQYIYSQAKNFDAEDLIQYNPKYDHYDVAQETEEKMIQYVDAYDEDTFWVELAERLSLRDIARQVGPVKQLTEQQLDQKYELEEKYYREFEKNGLKNVVVKDLHK